MSDKKEICDPDTDFHPLIRLRAREEEICREICKLIAQRDEVQKQRLAIWAEEYNRRKRAARD